MSAKDEFFAGDMFRRIAEPLEEHFTLPQREDAAYQVSCGDFIVDGKRAESEAEVVAEARGEKNKQFEKTPEKNKKSVIILLRNHKVFV